MTAAIIQARMGATRLPGKVLMGYKEKSFLEIMVERVSRAASIDRIIVATSKDPKDDIISEFCRKKGVFCYRGSEDDVLGRYYHCALETQAETIVRLTADCPLIDPVIIDKTIALFFSGNIDYASVNTPPGARKYPDGMDVEVFSFPALELAHKTVSNPLSREHVTFQFWKEDRYHIKQLSGEKNYSDYRITLDYPEDVLVIRFILEELERLKKFGYLKDIITILDKNPKIRNLNAKHFFGEGWKQVKN